MAGDGSAAVVESAVIVDRLSIFDGNINNEEGDSVVDVGSTNIIVDDDKYCGSFSTSTFRSAFRMPMSWLEDSKSP